MEQPHDPIEIAQAAVLRACQCLTAASPDALERSQTSLSEALTHLQAGLASPAGNGGRQDRLARVRQVRESTALAGQLLEAAGEYHRQWFSRLGELCGGYTATGLPAELGHASRWLARG